MTVGDLVCNNATTHDDDRINVSPNHIRAREVRKSLRDRRRLTQCVHAQFTLRQHNSTEREPGHCGRRASASRRFAAARNEVRPIGIRSVIRATLRRYRSRSPLVVEPDRGIVRSISRALTDMIPSAWPKHPESHSLQVAAPRRYDSNSRSECGA